MLKMIQISDDLRFALTNNHFSYILQINPEGILEHIHYGPPVSDPFSMMSHAIRTQRHAVTTHRGIQDFSLSDLPQEYPSFGTSDYRYPAVKARNIGGNSIVSLIYKSHFVETDRPKLEGLPSARGGQSETLTITLEDALSGLEVNLYYTIWQNHGVLARSACFLNTSNHNIDLEHVFSTSLDLPPADYDILHLRGTWAREMQIERFSAPKGRFTIDSARGASSAAHNPFLAVVEKDTTEKSGAVYATTLVYSGNHAFSVETGEFEDVRILAGLNPFGFQWQLRPGQRFDTPEALHVFTDKGLRGMSHIWHDFVRAKITPERFRNTPRPTYLNTWEAAYFDVTEARVLELADKAVDLGVDMLVLDDGWFEGRQDDTSSLGDWTADLARFPSGIPELASQIKAKGLKFGIWFEPEMVNPKSKLFEANPDWVLHVPGRVASLGRNQLTLDLSRSDVCDYLFAQIDAVLSCGDIDYVKWDMNRNMTEIGSAALPAHLQSEVSHRYMLGLYALLERLTTAYPDVLFENCASGGNRMDLGMLRFFPQTWTSDMCDPIGRLSIIHGASLYLPLECLAAYIGPSPNHQNGRKTSIETRFLAGAFNAPRGVSLSEADIDTHMNELRHWMAFAKRTESDFVGGQFDRLQVDANEVCWQYTTQDKSKVFLIYFHILSGPNLAFRRARLVELDPSATYIMTDGQTYGGDALMNSGLPLPYVSTAQNNPNLRYMPNGDFSAYLFEFEKRD